MQYYNPENREPRRWGLIAVIIYMVALIVLMLTIHFSVVTIDPELGGILVEFGDSDLGQGEEELAMTDVESNPQTPQEQDAEEQLEVDEREEIEIEQQSQEAKQEQDSPQPPQPKQDTVVKEERVVNKKALFPGRGEQNTATSQGSSEGNGNQGTESGGESGAAQGGGDGDQAIAVLKDRSVVGQLPKPAYRANATGRVIIDITVDDNGRVKSATYRSQGSTTNNSQLVSAAQEAALKARFTPSDNFIQGGTITYIFKMN